MRQPKLKAGALLSVLGIALIIALLLGAMLLLLYYNRKDNTQALRALKLERNLQSATTLLLSKPYSATTGPAETLDLYHEGTDSVQLQQYPWGIYEIALASAFENSDTLRKAFIKGRQINPAKAYVLYLKDDDRPLSVSGSTLIRGTAYLPPAGTRKAYIEDKAYQSDSTIFGPSKESEKSLPAVNAGLIAQLKQLAFDSLASHMTTAIPFETIQDSLSRSFFQEPLLISSSDSISLENMTLKGAIILVSKKAINVASSANIEQVILVAPSIHIADDFSGNLQAFAQDSLRVGQDCILSYPSVLGLLETRAENAVQEFTPEMNIGKNSTIHGIVFSAAARTNTDFMNRISLQPGSLIKGEVYADGLLEAKGSIHGSTACQRFMLRTPSSLYDNFLLDAQLDYSERSRYYLGSALLQVTSKGGVIKWLH